MSDDLKRESTPVDVALVTGAARGIGFGIARRLIGDRHAVVLLDRDRDGVEQARAVLAIEFPGARLLATVADVTSLAEIRGVVGEIEGELGRVDILVNNAGILRDRRLVNMSEEDWDAVIATNLKSNFLTAKATVPGMIDRGYGRIVNISSRAWLGGFGQTNYSAAKGGVVSFTRSLALELATKGVTVNAVAPGIIDTPMFQSLADEDRLRLAKTVPIGRVGTPDDVGGAVSFFASRSSSYITGQLIYVCGGRSLGAPSV